MFGIETSRYEAETPRVAYKAASKDNTVTARRGVRVKIRCSDRGVQRGAQDVGEVRRLRDADAPVLSTSQRGHEGIECDWSADVCAFDLMARSLFFFQAEDGIRDLTVTGVQTCALPI